MELRILAQDFLNSMANPTTKKAYKIAVGSYLNWLTTNKIKKSSKLKHTHFNEYAGELSLTSLRPISVKQKLHIIRAFYFYLIHLDLIPEKFSQKLAIPKRAPVRRTPGLTDKEALIILKFDFQRCENKFIYHRDKLIFYILLHFGLRISELTNLKVEDVIINPKGISKLFINGKGGFGEYMGINPKHLGILRTYLKYREKRFIKFSEDECDFFFITSKGKINQISTVQVRDILKIRLKEAGFNQRITPHFFRTTAISHVFEKAGPYIAKILARHKHLETTERYFRRRENLENHPALFIDYGKVKY